MRHVGTVASETEAKTIEDYLLTQSIPTKVLHGSQGWELWVQEDDHRQRATDLFEEFQINPGDSRYTTAATEARNLRREAQRREKERQKNFVDLRRRWQPVHGRRPLTFLLIAFSVLVWIATDLRNDEDAATMRDRLSIASWHAGRIFAPVLKEMDSDTEAALKEAMREPPSQRSPGQQRLVEEFGELLSQGVAKWQGRVLPEVRRGQVWRLVTPIFVHFGWLHIFFNMYILLFFGGMIETRQGTIRLALLVLVSAVASNLTQYLNLPWLWYMMGISEFGISGPTFGGMSGVNYALFGYVWMKSRYDPGSGLYVRPDTVVMLMVWFFLCMTGILPIANGAHTGGLVTGIVIGGAPYAWRKLLHQFGAKH